MQQQKGRSDSDRPFFQLNYADDYLERNASLISVNKTSSLLGVGGAAGAASSFFFMLFIALTTIKIANAMIMKSITVCKNTP
jgi:hypothetical protein